MSVTEAEREKRRHPYNSNSGERYVVSTPCIDCDRGILQNRIVGTKGLKPCHRCHQCAALLWTRVRKQMAQRGVPRVHWVTFIPSISVQESLRGVKGGVG